MHTEFHNLTNDELLALTEANEGNISQSLAHELYLRLKQADVAICLVDRIHTRLHFSTWDPETIWEIGQDLQNHGYGTLDGSIRP